MRDRSHLVLGLGVAAFALLLLTLWIPLDAETGLIERVRRRVSIGDALAPSIAGGFLLLGGLLLALAERPGRGTPRLTGALLGHIAISLAIIALATLIMRYAGPLSVALANPGGAEPLEYRLLRDTPPWKHIGFLLGGVVLIAGLIWQVERHLTLRMLLLALLATLAMIALYDLPFDDLLLPPNGDV
ncbi:MAG: hypothetical protein AAGC92_08385 [Pseudomonadota bacterium]